MGLGLLEWLRETKGERSKGDRKSKRSASVQELNGLSIQTHCYQLKNGFSILGSNIPNAQPGNRLGFRPKCQILWCFFT